MEKTSSTRTIGVVGAGLMGQGIAHVAALAGFDVILQDISGEAVSNALTTIKKNMQKGIDKGKVKPEVKNAALKKLTTTTDLKEMVNADLIIEAVPEDLEIKHQIFKALDQCCPSHTILATNTSAKSITEIACVTGRPEQVIGMHFFNPAHIMKLIELVKGLETSEETVQIAKDISLAMDKEPVLINEFPGFATSRINVLIGNEAFNMYMEGVGTPEDIDKAIKLGLNHPMGPFEMIDLVGLDTRLKVLRYLHESLGEKFRPCPLHVKYVKAGRLGRKVGKGVYEYDEEGRKKQP